MRSFLGLGTGTIAAGVEAFEQMLPLEGERRSQIQGFYDSTAQPAAEVAAMLAENIQQPAKETSKIVYRATKNQGPPG
jgi:EAL domain-containing protein (putative c-di-GMP-specific phosphodiesterase class I)